MTSRLTVALPKGRLLDDALELIRDLGVEGVDQDSRRRHPASATLCCGLSRSDSSA